MKHIEKLISQIKADKDEEKTNVIKRRKEYQHNYYKSHRGKNLKRGCVRPDSHTAVYRAVKNGTLKRPNACSRYRSFVIDKERHAQRP
jgi:hypothetical protein